MEVSTTPDYLRSCGFIVRSVAGTGSHVLYFCSAPFGRPALVVENGQPEEVNTTAIVEDLDSGDPRLCLVQEGTIILTYPESDYVVCYTTEVDVKDDLYYIVALDAVYEDPAGISILIDDHFTVKSQEFFRSKLENATKANEIVSRIVSSQAEASSLSSTIKKNYARMHSLRNKCNSLLQSGRPEDTISISSDLERLLSETEEAARSYEILAEKIIRY